MTDQELLDRAEQAARKVPLPDRRFDNLLRRRDRKRRNQRITAGFVGIVVFVAAVWIVTNSPFDQAQTPAVPGGAGTGPATGPTQTAPPPAPDSTAPAIVVRTGKCSGSATWWLGFAPRGERYLVQFEVHRSPVGHSWRIVLTQWPRLPNPGVDGVVFFRGIRVAAEVGEVVVHRRVPSLGANLVSAKAIDTQTGQACKVHEDIW